MEDGGMEGELEISHEISRNAQNNYLRMQTMKEVIASIYQITIYTNDTNKTHAIVSIIWENDWLLLRCEFFDLEIKDELLLLG